jgi:hypothetical protein
MLEILVVAAIAYITFAAIMIERRRTRMGAHSYRDPADRHRDVDPRDQLYFLGG